MLDTYGLHKIVWDACDERFNDILVASPADAGGRGISLAVREGGAAADMAGATHRQYLTSVAFAADMATYANLNLNYLLYSCTEVASVSGLGNLSGVQSMRYAFSSCSGLTSLDFRGFDPSTLTDLYYAFGGCSSLATIYADPAWALPSSGVSGSQCFYNCRALSGGNGTAWSSSNTNYTYMRIDKAGQAGYLTAA